MSTDNALSENEIIRIYGMRWNIETFFKASKSLLKLGREFQTRRYDSAVAHTAFVFARYTFLELLRRQENDPKTYGSLFFATKAKTVEKSQGFFDTLTQLVKELWSAA